MANTQVVTHSQLDILWHSIGMKRANYRRKLAWWMENDNHRNHFCIEVSGSEYGRDLNALCGLGYMKQGYRFDCGEAVYYHVTDAGITLAKKEFPLHEHLG